MQAEAREVCFESGGVNGIPTHDGFLGPHLFSRQGPRASGPTPCVKMAEVAGIEPTQPLWGWLLFSKQTQLPLCHTS
jgi:hypothetical protein